MGSGECDANSWGPLLVPAEGFVACFAFTNANLRPRVTVLIISGANPHMWSLVKDKLEQTVHVIKEGLIWHGPAARFARLVVLRLGGGGKWRVGVASEGVMNCFEWNPERPTQAPLACAKGCFE